MSKRGGDAIVRLSLRIPEHLRARLETEARRHGISLNAEMVLGLQRAAVAEGVAPPSLPNVEGVAQRLREVPYDPRTDLFLSLMDLLGDIQALQGTLLDRISAHPGDAERSAMLAGLIKMQNRLYALAREEGIKITDVLQSLTLKTVKAALAENPELEVGDRPQDSSSRHKPAA